MTSVQLQSVSKSFDGQNVLSDLDLDVISGKYVVLLGSSGCGKSTTLRIIAGLQSPDAGQVLLGGKSVEKVPPRRRDVAMVFQQDSLYPHLTVKQSICFALQGKLPPDDVQVRMDEAVELTKIASILSRRPENLSGGELRRASIAKAVARRCSVRLLDEPLSALDVPLRHELQNDLLHWHQAFPGTTIHVTHDGQEAMRMADQIAVMENGSIVQFDSPENIFRSPASIGVAKSVGSPPMNWIGLHCSAGRLQPAGTWLSCTDSFQLDNSLDGEVLVGVRPDAFHVDPDRNHSGLFIEGQVRRCQSVGRDLQLEVQAGDASLLVLIDHASWSGETGGSIKLTVHDKEAHVFNAQTQRRVG